MKSGPDLCAAEAETLCFISANTTIPVPKLRDVHWEDGKVTKIVMDFMPGKPLQEAWKGMDSTRKQRVAEELHGHISELRKLKGSYIGALGQGKAIIGKFSSLEGGPFDSEQEFNEFILGDMVRTAPGFLRHYTKHALSDDHEIVFTHRDFAPRNILVDEEGYVTAILDWESASWYPEYWEYIRAFRYLKPMPDWPIYLAQILPPKYEKEYIGMTFLNLFLRT